jgi:hypothetical protein
VAALRTPILLSDRKGFNLKTHLMVNPERFIEFVSELFLSLYSFVEKWIRPFILGVKFMSCYDFLVFVSSLLPFIL